MKTHYLGARKKFTTYREGQCSWSLQCSWSPVIYREGPFWGQQRGRSNHAGMVWSQVRSQNLTPLFLVTFIPKSNIVQLIERKKKYFPLPKAKEMAKISQYQMCKVYFKYYLLCLCERMHAREPDEKHKGRLFRELCKYAGTRRMIGEVDGCMGVQVSHCRDKAV